MNIVYGYNIGTEKGRAVISAPHNWENGEYKVHGKKIFGPDYYCDFLLDFIERNHQAKKPFFAYFPMNLVHTPFVKPPGDKSSAEVNFPSDLSKKEQLNGFMVHYMDKIVGRMLQKLKDLNIEENTIVIFTADNGTTKSLFNRLGDFKLKGGKRTMNEAGTRVPFIANWPKKIPAGKARDFFLDGCTANTSLFSKTRK